VIALEAGAQRAAVVARAKRGATQRDALGADAAARIAAEMTCSGATAAAI
jgi:hypothetical protein